MSESQSGVKSVRRDIAIVAGPKDWSDTRESWLARVPRAVRLALKLQRETVTFRTVKALWYEEITDPEHWAARDIRRAAQVIEARREANALADQYQTIAAGLSSSDPDFFRAEIDRLERLARIIGGQDRA
jgi:hypothetical protein